MWDSFSIEPGLGLGLGNDRQDTHLLAADVVEHANLADPQPVLRPAEAS